MMQRAEIQVRRVVLYTSWLGGIVAAATLPYWVGVLICLPAFLIGAVAAGGLGPNK